MKKIQTRYRQEIFKLIRTYLLHELSKRKFNALRLSREIGVARGTIRQYCGNNKEEFEKNYNNVFINEYLFPPRPTPVRTGRLSPGIYPIPVGCSIGAYASSGGASPSNLQILPCRFCGFSIDQQNAIVGLSGYVYCSGVCQEEHAGCGKINPEENRI